MESGSVSPGERTTTSAWLRARDRRLRPPRTPAPPAMAAAAVDASTVSDGRDCRRLGMTEGGPAVNPRDPTELVQQLNIQTSKRTPIQIDLDDEDSDDFWGEDGVLNNGSDDASSHAYALSREWKLRHDQFHTMGYRDGITEGMKASAQEGFNVGFKQSVHDGYKWGLVRGISSGLAKLPDQLKEKLIRTTDNRDGFRSLCKSTQEISTNDALKMLYDSIHMSGTIQSHDHTEGISHESVTKVEDLACNQLDSLFKELMYLLEAPESNLRCHFQQGLAG